MCFKNPLNKQTYSLPQKDSDSDSESPVVKKPTGFIAMQMIELEISLEQNCTLELIHKLTDLYSQAMEFFDDKDDPKCFDIQQRLHRMLKRPDVLEVLKSPGKAETAAKPPTFEQKRQDFEGRKKSMILTFKQSTNNAKIAEFTDIIVNHVEKDQEVMTKVVDSFGKQEEDLSSRLIKRKKAMGDRSFSTGSFIGMSDVSAGIDKELMMQNEIEEFLESHFSQQTTKVAEVNVRYESEINRIDGQGGVMNLVIDQMKKNRDDEVSALKKQFESIRKEQIMDIKKKYINNF